jgi:hypothetical protein
MKKYLLIAIVALGFAATACSGGQKTETATPPTEEMKPATPAADTTPAAVDTVTVKVDSTANK